MNKLLTTSPKSEENGKGNIIVLVKKMKSGVGKDIERQGVIEILLRVHFTK